MCAGQGAQGLEPGGRAAGLTPWTSPVCLSQRDQDPRAYPSSITAITGADVPTVWAQTRLSQGLSQRRRTGNLALRERHRAWGRSV